MQKFKEQGRYHYSDIQK